MSPETTASSVQTSGGDDGVFVVRMQNPPVNALGPPLLDSLDEALDAPEAGNARVIVISSAVSGFFAAGADIKTMVDVDRDGFVAYGHRLRSTVERVAALDRPTIAAIEGNSLGGGLELALACTLRVAARGSKLGLPEAKIGLIPSAGATQRLPKCVGRGRALELILTARLLGAEEAAEIGLVDRVADPGQAEAQAARLATRMAGLSLPALMDAVRLVDASFSVPLSDGLAGEESCVETLFDGPDPREGMQAFLEKRTPRFQRMNVR